MVATYDYQKHHATVVQNAQERAILDAQPCPVCFEFVHPNNYERHMALKHPKEVVPKNRPPLVIDDEFRALIPPQSPEENTALEESILADGCRDALVVWKEQNILIDGHNRHEICIRHSLPYEVRDKSFESREDVIAWMVHNQLARRNISTFVRSELVGRLKSAIEAKAKANLATSTGGANPQPLKNSTKAEKPAHTRKQMAQLADTSEDTIRKVEAIVKDAPAPIVERARKEEISIHRAFLMTTALKGATDQIIAFITTHSIDDPERVEILKRLEKSANNPGSNDTYGEILRTGGFHYGDNFDKWCDFINDGVQKIQRALDSIAAHHAAIVTNEKLAASYTPAETTTDEPTAPAFILETQQVNGLHYAVIRYGGFATNEAALDGGEHIMRLYATWLSEQEAKAKEARKAQRKAEKEAKAS